MLQLSFENLVQKALYNKLGTQVAVVLYLPQFLSLPGNPHHLSENSEISL